jgi:hypothetical protein
MNERCLAGAHVSLYELFGTQLRNNTAAFRESPSKEMMPYQNALVVGC